MENNLQLTEMKEKFWRDGYVKLGTIFDTNEVSILLKVIANFEGMKQRHHEVKQKFDQGNYPSFESIFVMDDVFSDNIFALATRKKIILDNLSYFFNDDAYLYHCKVPLKYPSMPGFKYHQDYYYWYQMGCIYPDMATCFIALDPSTKENGCLKFIPQSHNCGRIDHILHNGFSDSEANPERTRILKERNGEELMELNPGEAVVFHGNLLHGSSTNDSPHSRIALIGCYNTKHNSPINRDWTHPPYAKQERFDGKLDESYLNKLPDMSVSFKETLPSTASF